MTNKNEATIKLTLTTCYSIDDIERALERFLRDFHEGTLVSFEIARGYGVSFIYHDETGLRRSGCVSTEELYAYLNEDDIGSVEEIAFAKDTNFYRVVDNYECEDETEYDYEDEAEEE